ncbi:MAG: hypothetical protein KF851_11170 [Pirellulaceae bacterium]|nr:hypothetical protein [Pirellulaceae bacterium]
MSAGCVNEVGALGGDGEWRSGVRRGVEGGATEGERRPRPAAGSQASCAVAPPPVAGDSPVDTPPY